MLKESYYPQFCLQTEKKPRILIHKDQKAEKTLAIRTEGEHMFF